MFKIDNIESERKKETGKNLPFMTTSNAFNDLLYSSLQAFVLRSFNKYKATHS